MTQIKNAPEYNQESFAAAAEPLIKWLSENANPHAAVIVEPTGAVLYSGEISHQTDKFVKD